MDYDPVKKHLAGILGRSVALRRLFHLLLDLLFLRAWYVRRELWRLRRKIPTDPLILDAGMGFGQYSDRMMKIYPRAGIVGLEIDRDHFYNASDYFSAVHPGVRFLLGDVQGLPLAGGRFDLVLSVDVMEHILDDETTFSEFFRILKPGGYFVMHTPRDRGTDPAVHEVHRAGWTVGEHVRDGYTDDDAVHKLESAGLRVLHLVRGYGPFGRVAWMLLQRVPMTLLKASMLLVPVVVLYFLIILPAALFAMLLDLVPGNQRNGGSLLVTAQKPAGD